MLVHSAMGCVGHGPMDLRTMMIDIFNHPVLYNLLFQYWKSIKDVFFRTHLNQIIVINLYNKGTFGSR